MRNVLIDDNGQTWGPAQTNSGTLKAMFGVDPAKEYGRWQEYTDHLRRRNDVSHRGHAISAADAEASIAVVDDLWLWLTNAAHKS